MVFQSRIAAPPAVVFAFHERPDAARLLTPVWSGARVVAPAPSLRPGATAVIRLGCGPLAMDWVARHVVYEPPRLFVDRQESGPFVAWEHRHQVLPAPSAGDGAAAAESILRDEVRYCPPLGALGEVADLLLIRPFLRRLFRHRHAVTRRFCEAAR